MPVSTFSRFAALLAFAALAAGLIALFRPRTFSDLGFRSGVGLAALVAGAATAGSLLYSEYYLFEPCRLCWYQRIAMYPLALTLAIGWWKQDRSVVRYAVAPAIIGAGISVWHLVNQWVLTGTTCDVGPSCAIRYVTEFGFVTIPFMALSGFVAIVGLTLAVRNK
ncbi:MAG TPA: disulfide bond formation protein B [Acidimicrobiia bacterium]|nr:disulfide bond formation protein B [Acidimicrobiia bacterium]